MSNLNVEIKEINKDKAFSSTINADEVNGYAVKVSDASKIKPDRINLENYLVGRIPI